MKKFILLFFIPVLLLSCGGEKTVADLPLFSKEAFDAVVDGKPVSLYTLRNGNGMAVQLTNYGARIVDIWVPTAQGEFIDVTTGFENIGSYLNAQDGSHGPIVGRYGNRIAKGKFEIDGNEYTLELNDKGNHIHGGSEGFASKVWDAKETVTSGGVPAVVMSYRSEDGEAGYPGNLDLEVKFTLTDKNELVIEYNGTTDAPTVLNPTSHPYFNLHGNTNKHITSHIVTIYADHYTPTDPGLIPTGEIVKVEGTPLDFRKPEVVGARIDDDFDALKYGGGYDHNFVLNKKRAPGVPELAAEVYEPSTGVVMKVLTDRPGVQFYTANHMDGSEMGKHGKPHNRRAGLAFETQNFPDSPNHENFPSAVLRPGETYTHTCIYSFGVREE